jgi:hypothetical protein
VSLALHLHRRNAVYYYRRRLPPVLTSCFHKRHIFLSLRTANPVIARRIVVLLDARLEAIMTLAEQDELHATAPQLEAMLRGVVADQLAKLDRVAAAAKAFPDFFNPDQSRADDRRAMWAFTLLDAQGSTAVVRPDDADRMRGDGLAEQDIDAVQDHLTMLRVNEFVPTKLHILRPMLEAVGLPLTAMNLAQAQAIYFQGMKMALAQHDRRYGANRIEDGMGLWLLIDCTAEMQGSATEQLDRPLSRRDLRQLWDCPFPYHTNVPLKRANLMRTGRTLGESL